MTQDWAVHRSELLGLAACLTSGERDIVRIADLLTAQAYAHSLGLLPRLDPEDVEPSRRQLSSSVALFALPPGAAEGEAWRAATAVARHVAGKVFDPSIANSWSHSSQAADPGRKSRGAYSTHHELAVVMAHLAASDDPRPMVLDPSAGHGALLLAVFQELRSRGYSVAHAARALHGVELDAHARELCCLKLWLAASDADVPLDDVARRIAHGNALCASWRSAGGQIALLPSQDDGEGCWLDWFPELFREGGFPVVVANPPWESLRHAITASREDWRERQRTHDRLRAERPGSNERPPSTV